LRFVVFLLLSSCTGESKLLSSLDNLLFKVFGGTISLPLEQISAQQFHLDNGQLVGRDVVVKGKVVSVGRYGTHIVIADDSGRILVVLTGLKQNLAVGGDLVGRSLTIWGAVILGKKGLPYLEARVYTVEDVG
jgi:hypothetical protein